MSSTCNLVFSYALKCHCNQCKHLISKDYSFTSFVLLFFFSSSPKSKQEAMVRSPPVMSPSSAAQMDSKLPNQGKQGGAGSQSQPSPCDPKALSGSHTPKGPQGSVGSMGLKNGQGLNSGNGAKSKIKRERSTSIESFEQRDTGTPNNEGDQKGRKAHLSPGKY